MFIHNEPDYAQQYRFLVVRFVEGEAWFYGAYAAKDRAAAVAADVGGCIIDREEEGGLLHDNL